MVESLPVKLSRLFAGIDDWRVVGTHDVDVSALTYSSTQVIPGALFFCVTGFSKDGHDYAAEAVSRGAVALCAERELPISVPQVVVPSVRRIMGPVAAAFYGWPSRRLVTLGVTGTNGKTTSAFLIAHLLDSAGVQAGLLGTVERRIGGQRFAAGRTTPEAIDLQRDLASMAEAGDRAAVMEVSSHALALDRVRGTKFRAIAFTNLTQDHLDFHGTLDSYFAAKSQLFVDAEYLTPETVAVINVDDPYGRRLALRFPSEQTLTFSTDAQGADQWMAESGRTPDLQLVGHTVTRQGMHATVAVRGQGAARAGFTERERRLNLSTTLVGKFNLANVLTALGLGLAVGLDLEQMIADVFKFAGVPGRMEPVEVGQEFRVLVDYAHTPDSVRNVLTTARAITPGRVIAVLGCGGNRDKRKRPLMGREAEMGADIVVVTSDNPRSEDPLAIISDILAGLAQPDRAIVEPDRRLAIAKALALAQPSDTVMILGKGHETGQEFADRTVPFDDREVARQLLVELCGLES
ncbi:MAG: UDP-N-acetylmuramoyl-L-alanyl-D-glutamate--2,6-diaminopimelate ligase [Thermoleophilia bacterium]|nr:UDP-N-acetylmuramoyl-L-alanyl-D-glutamate--2,6-diaminopimelate ligase [Thermoleophilia bacterium]